MYKKYSRLTEIHRQQARGPTTNGRTTIPARTAVPLGPNPACQTTSIPGRRSPWITIRWPTACVGRSKTHSVSRPRTLALISNSPHFSQTCTDSGGWSARGRRARRRQREAAPANVQPRPTSPFFAFFPLPLFPSLASARSRERKPWRPERKVMAPSQALSLACASTRGWERRCRVALCQRPLSWIQGEVTCLRGLPRARMNFTGGVDTMAGGDRCGEVSHQVGLPHMHPFFFRSRVRVRDSICCLIRFNFLWFFHFPTLSTH
jgi:hypothetical protein